MDHDQLEKILKEMGIPDHLTCLLRNLCAGQEATVRTGHGTTDWFQIGKGVHQGCILSPCLFIKIHLVKAMVFPVVMYGCESWTIRKAEHQRIDTFELWCWRRLLRVPWPARRSNQSIVSPSICHEMMGLDAMILFFWKLSFKPALSLSFFTSSRGSLVPLRFLPLESYHLLIWGCWYFSRQSWFQRVLHQPSISHVVLCI